MMNGRGSLAHALADGGVRPQTARPLFQGIFKGPRRMWTAARPSYLAGVLSCFITCSVMSTFGLTHTAS